MKIFLFIYALLLSLLLPVLINGQTDEVKFTLITGSNGINLGKINGMTRDKYGAMWLSDETNHSITRYDGTQMTTYLNDPNNANSLGGHYPECLLADTAGTIWIGFYGQGLDKFDPETNTFTHYNNIPEDNRSLSNDTVTALLIDHLGNFWVATYGGLNLFDPKTGIFKHFKHNSNDTSSLSHDRIRSLYEDREGTLWVGTGLAWDNNTYGGLNRFNRESENFNRYLHDPLKSNSLIDNKIRAIFEDSRGNFWVGSKGDGLHRMNRKTGTFERITSHNPDIGKPCRPPVQDAYDHITFITEDAFGYLWIGTLSNGLCRYDPFKHTNTFFNLNSKNGFTDNSGWWVQAFPDGLFLVSTQEAHLFIVELYSNFIQHQILGNTGLRDFVEEDDSVFWMTTPSALIRKDFKSGQTEQFTHDPADQNSISNYPNYIIRDKEGIYWISTTQGINRFDSAKRKFSRYQNNASDAESLSSNDTGLMFEDAESNLWVGTYGGGLNMLDKETGKFKRYRHNDADTSSISDDLITGLLFDEVSGDIWAGTFNSGGLNRMNTKTEKFKHYIQGVGITDLFKSSDGMIWAGAVEGLYWYDKPSDRFVLLNQPYSITDILSLIEDDDQNLWIGAAEGLFRLDSSRQHIVRLGTANGINGRTLLFNSSVKSKNGHLYFGTQGGYYTFNPKDIKIISSSLNVQLSNLWLNGKLVSPGPRSSIYESIDRALEIHFEHNQNTFSLSYSMINFGHHDDKVIYYQLENYEQDWQKGDAAGQAYYYNIPPGKYRFLIKASNLNTGEWTEREVDVTISPPWWNTYWSYGMYGIVFIGIVFFGYRFQKKLWLKAEREKNKDRELAQAREMEKAYHDLKITQTQLIHSEKMASLGELTAGIAHEIQNPLNFVNNFSEVNSELIAEMKQELEKGKIDDAKTIANNIDENEQKIIFHGKRADAIVKGMLMHSRTSSGVKELTDINALADEYLRLAYHGLRAKDKTFNATMKTDFDPTIGKINVVPQDVGRVILNLITNAFYAVSEKRKQLDTGYEPMVMVSTFKSGNKIEIKVNDNGNGIPRQALDKIFQPFFTTKPTGQGTGLGLSLSYDIIKAHGGDLKVETKEGEGSEFIIQLPFS